MEDALARAGHSRPLEDSSQVLILVVMEDALALCLRKCLKTHLRVLILVVMEDALAPQNLGYALFKRIVRLDCAS